MKHDQLEQLTAAMRTDFSDWKHLFPSDRRVAWHDLDRLVPPALLLTSRVTDLCAFVGEAKPGDLDRNQVHTATSEALSVAKDILYFLVEDAASWAKPSYLAKMANLVGMVARADAEYPDHFGPAAAG